MTTSSRLPALALAATCVALIVTAAPRSGPDSLTVPAVAVQTRTGAPQPKADAVARAVGRGESPQVPEPIFGAPQAARTARGWATYYEDPRKDGPYAAAPWFRWGQDPEWVSVCAFPDGQAVCTNALVSDFCACGKRHGIPTVIDLAPSVFRELAPLSRGIVRVQVDRGASRERAAPVGPETDVGP